jgi:DNA-directed RNA polymerase specialized sigma24 family protein
MEHVENRPPPGTWQQAVQPLVGLVAYHALRLCRAHNVPLGDRDDVVAEALLDLCLSVRRSWARGVRGVDCRFFALHGLQAARRGRRVRLLGDVFEHPEGLAAGGLGPEDEAVARDELQALLARLPGERLRQVVRLKAEGLSTAEVAGRLNCCRQRVQQMLQEARAVLLAR